MEIGSIFEIDPCTLFARKNITSFQLPFMAEEEWNTCFFNTGRAAIEALIKMLLSSNYGTKDIWVPAFVCSSVYEAVERAEGKVHFYPVEKDLSLSEEKMAQLPITKDSIFYCVHFFGRSLSNAILKVLKSWQAKGIILIEDITLSALSTKSQDFGFGDYIIASLRKWLSIPDGAVIVSKKQLQIPFEYNQTNDYTSYYFAAQIMKFNYLQNKDLDKQEFLDLSRMGMEKLFSDYKIREISFLSKRLLSNIDMKEVVAKRTKNYHFLYVGLKGMKHIKLLVPPRKGIVPLGMIISCENRDQLFEYLIRKGVYCNIHWRLNRAIENYEQTIYLSNSCITIPCDQRYNEMHMQYIIDVLKEWEEINV